MLPVIHLLGAEKREKIGDVELSHFNILIQKFNALSLHITEKG